MSRRNLATDTEPEVSLGMDSTTPITGMKPGFLREAYNVRLGLEKGYTKRNGMTSVLSSAYGSLNITAGIEFYDGSIRKTIVFGTDGTTNGGSYGFISSGAVVDIETGLSGTLRPTFVIAGKSLVFANGTDISLSDGATARQFGITAPASAPTSSSTGTNGDLSQLATYIYAYTYFNSETGAESSPSPLSAGITLTGSNDRITIAVVAGDADTADQIRVWRTVGDGNQLFLDGTAAISATSYVSTKADQLLGQPLEFDNDRLEDWTTEANFPVICNGRMFWKTGPNEIRWSRLGRNGSMFESYAAEAFCSTAGTLGDTDEIVGLGVANGRVVVVKRQSAGILQEYGQPDILLGADNTIFLYEEKATNGGVSHHAGVSFNGFYAFLGREDVYVCDGQQIAKLGGPIRSTIRSLGFLASQSAKLSAVNNTSKQTIEFQVFESSTAEFPKYRLVGDYQKFEEAKIRWTLDRPGTDVSTHPGQVLGCLFETTDSDTGAKVVYGGNLAGNGKLFELDSGDSDDGANIYDKIVTRPYDYGSELSEKLIKTATLFLQGDGDDYSVTVSSIYDLSGDEEDAQTISLNSGGAQWDVAVWDVDIWTSNQVRPRKYQPHRIATWHQLVIKQGGAKPLTHFEWTTTASKRGVR